MHNARHCAQKLFKADKDKCACARANRVASSGKCQSFRAFARRETATFSANRAFGSGRRRQNPRHSRGYMGTLRNLKPNIPQQWISSKTSRKILQSGFDHYGAFAKAISKEIRKRAAIVQYGLPPFPASDIIQYRPLSGQSERRKREQKSSNPKMRCITCESDKTLARLISIKLDFGLYASAPDSYCHASLAA